VRSRLALVAVLGPLFAAVLALTAAPATAESWHIRDRHRDVRSYELTLALQPHECDQVVAGDYVPGDRLRDITAVQVDHGVDSVVAAVRLAEVRLVDKQTSYELVIRTPTRTFIAEIYRGPRGKRAVDLQIVRPSRDPDAPSCGPVLEIVNDVDCAGMVGDADPHADTVTVTIPRACLDTPSWVRLGVATGGFDAKGFDPRKPLTVVSDTWGERDAFTHLLPAVGPKVHADQNA